MDTSSREQKTLSEAAVALGQLRVMVEEALRDSDWTLTSHAETEAPALTMLVVSHARGVELLAGADVLLLMPAAAAARSAYEAAVTTAWLVQPDDAAHRDHRWLALLVDERRFWRQMGDEFKGRPDGADAERLMRVEHDRVDAIIKVAEPQLAAAGVAAPQQVPGYEALLKDLGKRDRDYFMYRQICQVVHPKAKALSHVRSMANHGHEDPDARYGYSTRPGDWALTIGVTAGALWLSAKTLASRMNPSMAISAEALAAWERITEAVQRLAALPPG